MTSRKGGHLQWTWFFDRHTTFNHPFLRSEIRTLPIATSISLLYVIRAAWHGSMRPKQSNIFEALTRDLDHSKHLCIIKCKPRRKKREMREKKKERKMSLRFLRWVVCWKFNNDRPLQSWMDYWWEQHPSSRLAWFGDTVWCKGSDSLEARMFIMGMRRGRSDVVLFCQRSMFQPQ